MKRLKHTSRKTQLSDLTSDNDALRITEGLDQKMDSQSIPWRNGIYKLWWNFTQLFKNPFKERKKELRLLDQVSIIISEGNPEDVADTCEKYISLHRIVENTRARKRLEKWITRLIFSYLTVILFIVLVSGLEDYAKRHGFPYIHFDIKVLVVLLTTTTVNIVALGFILTRGLFHEHEKKDLWSEKPVEEKQAKNN